MDHVLIVAAKLHVYIAVLELAASRVLRTCCPRGSSLDLWYNCRVRLDLDLQSCESCHFPPIFHLVSGIKCHAG